MPASSSHRLGGCLSTLPGAAMALYALTIDWLCGRGLVNDWGTGQTVFLAFGVLVSVLGWLIHVKSVRDEDTGRRRYSRTMLFVMLPVFVLSVLPLLIGEVAVRVFYRPPPFASAYHRRHTVFGVVLEPNREYRVSSVAKAFDIQIRIDESGHRIDESSIPISDADIFVTGDSHPFGWGVKQSETLSAHLADQCRMVGLSAKVVNGGVPGYGPAQSLLRVESLAERLPEKSTIVLFLNPVNDMVNLSMDVDYQYPKPHALYVDGEFVIGDPPDLAGLPFHFSPPFWELNEVFNSEVETVRLRSELLRWISGADTVPSLPSIAGVVQMRDETPADQYLAEDRQRIIDRPANYAARFWPEMPAMRDHRPMLRQIAEGVLARLKRSCEQSKWKLIVVLAPEALHYQGYSKRYLEQVGRVWAGATIEPGWTRTMLEEICERLAVTTVTWKDIRIDPERSFVQNDDHTSGMGHKWVAEAVVKKMREQ